MTPGLLILLLAILLFFVLVPPIIMFIPVPPVYLLSCDLGLISLLLGSFFVFKRIDHVRESHSALPTYVFSIRLVQ